ncbi:MAG TPA: hypothetical protein VIG64_09700 [Actinomycetota bacterium]|jgi:Ca2+-binding RTX toxin-like protein
MTSIAQPRRLSRTWRALAVSCACSLALGGVSGHAAERPTCKGQKATVVGTPDADELQGTEQRDVIVGMGGEDQIVARGGNDLVCSGRGADFVEAGTGADRVDAGKDSDTVHGGRGDDSIATGRGAVEALFGGAGDDRLSGGAGDFDGLIGGPGDDVLDGGGGLDTAEFWDSTGGIVADLRSDSASGFGDDAVIDIEGIVGSNYDDVLDGDDESNRLVGQAGDDVLRAHDSGPLEGGLGDIVEGGPDDDLIDGGDGADVASYDDAPAAMTVDLDDGTATGEGTDDIAGIEAVIASDFDDELLGDGGDNAFAGGAGNDLLDGRGGRDQAAYFDANAPVDVDLEAGTATGWGSDTLIAMEDVVGSAGPDTLAGDGVGNVIDGGSRSDSIRGADGDDVLLGGPGDDDADGGDGSDACDAETESNCEGEPPRLGSWSGLVTGWPLLDDRER